MAINRCLVKFFVDANKDAVVHELEQLATDLLRQGSTPIFVFDGNKCPGKKRAHAQRQKVRLRCQNRLEEYVGCKMSEWSGEQLQTVETRLTEIINGDKKAAAAQGKIP